MKARGRGRCRPGRDVSVKKGDHVIPLYTPECRECPSCLAQDQSLHRDPRHAGPGPDARRHLALLDRQGQDPPLYGLLDLLQFTVLPEIAVAKIDPDAPFDKICYIGCGVTTGIGAVINTAKVEIGATASSSVSAASASTSSRACGLAGADMIIGVDINNDKKAWGERFGMTHFVNPKEIEGDIVPTSST
jgi:S-(hydroxymethyl)glutathione dehydrogenase/alcohol dehydrogenase